MAEPGPPFGGLARGRLWFAFKERDRSPDGPAVGSREVSALSHAADSAPASAVPAAIPTLPPPAAPAWGATVDPGHPVAPSTGVDRTRAPAAVPPVEGVAAAVGVSAPFARLA